jgi:two-component system response regulator AtoC
MLFLRDIIPYVKSDFHALVIDDEPQVSGFVAQILRTSGWNVQEARNAEEAYNLLAERPWQLVFCDVVLGGPDGYEVLRSFSEQQPKARFVLMTGHGSAAGALDATAIGAYDYLVKPFTIEDVIRISEMVRARYQGRSARKPVSTEETAGYMSDIPLIGKSPKFVECLKMVGRVAGTGLPVLIAGESGTGKEVVARAVHRRSDRARNAFVTVNCGAIPVELIESELFGHTKGSFTGADRERAGLWEDADGGTIFLDEITETNPLFQVKLLRALQEGEIRRVGSNRTVKVDVRVIAATNREIEDEVKSGRFRQDLMYRLNAVTINLPPLRERREDISLLANHFVKQVRPGADSLRFSSEALAFLESYQWPGNIRELENAVLHAASMSDDIIYPEHLSEQIRGTQKNFRSSELPASETPGTWPTLDEMEEKYIDQVLSHTGGNKQAAARILNIDRKTLTRIVNRAKKEPLD